MQSRPEKSEAPVAVTTEASSVNNPSIKKGIDMQNSTALVIAGTSVRQLNGLYSLNDLHKAAGSEAKHQPALFMRGEQTQALIGEIGNSTDSQSFKTKEGRNGGTYACKELVIAYAAWISAAFHLKVIRVFLDSVQPAAPTIDYARISPAEAQDLKQIVKAIVDAGVQTHGETWARLQRKFKVNSYLKLPASQYDAARTYLIAKLPADQASHDVHDAVTLELSDTQRMELAFSTAAEASAHVQRTVFKAMMTGKNADWRQARYLLSLGYDRDGQATLPFAQALGDGQIVASLPELAKHITNADIMASDTQLTTLASACMQRLNERAAVRERCAATAVAMVPATAPAAHPATAVQSTTTAAPIPPHIGLDGKPLPPGTFRAVFV